MIEKGGKLAETTPLSVTTTASRPVNQPTDQPTDHPNEKPTNTKNHPTNQPTIGINRTNDKSKGEANTTTSIVHDRPVT